MAATGCAIPGHAVCVFLRFRRSDRDGTPHVALISKEYQARTFIGSEYRMSMRDISDRTDRLRTLARVARAVCAVLATSASVARAQTPAVPPCVVGQSLDDAWWTGPMLAPSAGTLPPGHFLLEPYLFDVGVHGRFDREGARQRAAPSHTIGSLEYALYGLANKVMIGALPIAGYTAASDGPNSSSVKLGDLTVLGQYRLAQFRPCHWWPTTSINVQQ